VGSLMWRSTQVVWTRTKTASGACGNRHGRERERKDVRAQAANGWRMRVRMGGHGQHVGTNVHCVHRRKGEDSMRAPTSNACADARPRTGEHGRQGVCLTSAFAKLSAKSCDHLQQSYTIQCISQNLIYHILWLKITALRMEVTHKFYL
jgi:hypothetical protein